MRLSIIAPVLMLSVLLWPAASRAEYAPYNFNWMQISLFHGENFPAVNRTAVDDTYLEFEGFHRWDLMDLYWFVDFADINNSAANDTHDSDSRYYTEIKPRLSLDGLLHADLTLGPISEWFLAYELDKDDTEYGGGLMYHNLGIGLNLAGWGFQYFHANLFGRYIGEDYDNVTEKEWDGLLFNLDYGRPLHTFAGDLKLNWSGWLDYIFAAHYSDLKPGGRSTSFQWYNQLKLAKGRWGISYALKINHGFGQTDDGPGRDTDTVAQIVGVHVSF